MASVSTISAIDLLAGLVEIPSTSGNEHTAVEWLVDAMSGLGYSVAIDGAGNAIGSRGSGRHEIMLLGHIDTVAGDIPVRIEDGILYGRGAVDAKGPLAAFAAAGARAALPDGVRLTVAGAVGEETFGSPGATWLCAERPAPAAVIIGEPSGWDGVVLGYKGSLGMTAIITRPLSHSAGPETTAPELALKFWSRVMAWQTEQNGDKPGAFETIDGTLRSINTTSDGLIERVSLDATFRLPTSVTMTWVREQIAALDDSVDFAWQMNADAWRTDKRSPIVAPFLAAIRSTGGSPRIKVKTGTSDMNVVGPVWNCPIVAYGPGDARFDHTPDEQIALAEYERGIEVLTRAIEQLAASITSWNARQP